MSESDDSLDLKSEKFDPLKALYSPNVHIPSPAAQTFPSVESYLDAVKKGEVGKPKTTKKKDDPAPSTSQVTRRFLPHQMPVSRPPPARVSRTVLTRMEEELAAGPLAALAACMQQRTRVKVYTRHMSGVRGYVEAFVAAFDKHWNMALEDVREVWLRRQRPRVPALGAAACGRGLLARARRGAVPPRVLAQALPGGRERCERHVGQLLMRGEHVVLVVVGAGRAGAPGSSSAAAAGPSAGSAGRAAPAASAGSSTAPASAMGLSDAVAAAVAAAMASSRADEENSPSD